MKDLETVIFARITGDSVLTSLIPALNMLHGFQNTAPKKPQLTFWLVAGTKGVLRADEAQVTQIFYDFGIFSNDYLDVCARLKRLFDGQVFPPPVGATEADCIFADWDQDFQDNFDENLKIKRKECRIRFTIKLKPQDPIA